MSVGAIATPVNGFSWRRVGAMVMRHVYVLRRSWPRLLEIAYWPTMQLFLWGFITNFFVQHSSWVAQAAGVLISAVLLWDVLFRANLGITIPFLEEMWARNLASLFVSPLRPSELIVSLYVMSIIRTTISVAPAALLALPLYGVWVFDLGPPLIAFYVNLLIMGWALGVAIAALVLRYGLAAESLCWLGVFMMAPVSCIYYPIDTLPGWLKVIALALPASHVFEGMRAVLFHNVFRWDLFWNAVLLNALYLALSAGLFIWMVGVARKKGLLLQQGE